jgi:hypothetical protein
MILVRKLLELMEKVREAYRRGGIKEALNARGLLTHKSQPCLLALVRRGTSVV